MPCGLIAWSLFNDTYSFTSGGTAVTVNKKGISWKSDREHKFGNVYPENFPNNLPSNQNGSLIGGASLDPNVPVSLLSSCAHVHVYIWGRKCFEVGS